MTARTTPDDVLETFDADAEPAEVQEWIEDAGLLVDDIEATSYDITEHRLERIERLVTQHYLCAQYPRFTDQEGGARSASYGEGRAETSYLDRAQRLDPSGVIASSLDGPDFTLST